MMGASAAPPTMKINSSSDLAIRRRNDSPGPRSSLNSTGGFSPRRLIRQTQKATHTKANTAV